MQWLSPTIKVL